MFLLPDISKWNTTNVTLMNDLFKGCSSLMSLPDISKWNINNVKNKNDLFDGCISLTLLLDLKKKRIKILLIKLINFFKVFN